MSDHPWILSVRGAEAKPSSVSLSARDEPLELSLGLNSDWPITVGSGHPVQGRIVLEDGRLTLEVNPPHRLSTAGDQNSDLRSLTIRSEELPCVVTVQDPGTVCFRLVVDNEVAVAPADLQEFRPAASDESAVEVVDAQRYAEPVPSEGEPSQGDEADEPAPIVDKTLTLCPPKPWASVRPGLSRQGAAQGPPPPPEAPSSLAKSATELEPSTSESAGSEQGVAPVAAQIEDVDTTVLSPEQVRAALTAELTDTPEPQNGMEAPLPVETTRVAPAVVRETQPFDNSQSRAATVRDTEPSDSTKKIPPLPFPEPDEIPTRPGLLERWRSLSLVTRVALVLLPAAMVMMLLQQSRQGDAGPTKTKSPTASSSAREADQAGGRPANPSPSANRKFGARPLPEPTGLGRSAGGEPRADTLPAKLPQTSATAEPPIVPKQQVEPVATADNAAPTTTATVAQHGDRVKGESPPPPLGTQAGLTLQRRAVDALAAGDSEAALAAYQQWSAKEPANQPARRAVEILANARR